MVGRFKIGTRHLNVVGVDGVDPCAKPNADLNSNPNPNINCDSTN